MAKQDIRPLQTTYKGFRFRSRLEARWAVLFDAMDIKFHYEPQGFRLSDGTCYLPDFYLPQVRLYAEVKPDTLTAEELGKCDRLANGQMRGVILLEGPPDFMSYPAIFPEEMGTPVYTDVLLDIEYHNRKLYENENRLFTSIDGLFQREEDFTFRYRYAVYKSRSERFEEAA